MKYLKISVNDIKFHSTFCRLSDYLKPLLCSMAPTFTDKVRDNTEQFKVLISQFISNDYNFTHGYKNNDFVEASHIKVEFTDEVNKDNPDELAIFICLDNEYANASYGVFFIE